MLIAFRGQAAPIQFRHGKHPHPFYPRGLHASASQAELLLTEAAARDYAGDAPGIQNILGGRDERLLVIVRSLLDP